MISKSSKSLLGYYFDFCEKSLFLKDFFEKIYDKKKLSDDDLCMLLGIIEKGEKDLESVCFWREQILEDFKKEKVELKRKQILIFIQRNNAMKKEIQVCRQILKKLNEKWNSIEGFANE
ncbi:MAG: hypothetical protein WC795_00335 [Candidatus Paceibacterota bacterium]|jgi:hypothetical protein